MDHIDHISNRVVAFALTGVVAGASISTYKALPFPKTTLSVAASFALTSTACLLPERIIYHSSFYFVGRSNGDDNDHTNSNGNSNSNSNSNSNNKLERRRLIGSHIGGGIIGGTISGSLFQRRFSLNGMGLFTPLMIALALGELYIQDYRRQRLKEIATASTAPRR